MEPIPYIRPQNALSNALKKDKYIDQIFKRIISYKEFRKYKLDMEFLLFICLVIEHMIKPRKKQKGRPIDKQQLLLDAYDRAFGDITDSERNQIRSYIQFLHDNGQIKKMSSFKILYKSVYYWLKSKFNH
ncbi:MAG TPA: hypothetical protein V6C58_00570 [Allocoleopsis sp.]